MKPTRCIDPVVRYCQGCRYGYVSYHDWIETREGLDGCCFESGCTYGLEDTQTTEEYLAEFDRWVDKWNGVQT